MCVSSRKFRPCARLAHTHWLFPTVLATWPLTLPCLPVFSSSPVPGAKVTLLFHRCRSSFFSLLIIVLYRTALVYPLTLVFPPLDAFEGRLSRSRCHASSRDHL